MNNNFTFGIEEELFLADATTGASPDRSLKPFHEVVRRRVPDAERELLQSQVEIASPPSTSFADTRSLLAGMRADLAKIGEEHGIALLASGTHPLADWGQQKATEKARYRAINEELQIIAQRNVVCGMHVHVEVPDPDRRIDLMKRLLPYMPLLLAMSASSPFWQGRDTGLAAYRLSVWGAMPRTGLPDLFSDAAEYESYVAAMVEAGAIKDASFLWWTIRPSIHYPTLELRVADSCTKLEDTLAIAALYRCLVRRAVLEPDLNAGMTGASRAIVSENLWRAQRDGVQANFIDQKAGKSVSCADYLAALLERLDEDAAELDCARELSRTRDIVASGSSADHQVKVFTDAKERGLSDRDAIASAVDWIARNTVDSI